MINFLNTNHPLLNNFLTINTLYFMKNEETVMTLHPEGKQGTSILKRRYEMIKEFIIQVLQEEKELSFKDLTELAHQHLQQKFDGKITWYIVTVKLDLEARKIIERIPKSSPQRLRLRM